VLFAIGDITGGLVLYIENGALRLSYNGFGEFRTLEGPALSAGERVATLEFEALGRRRGRGRLVLDIAGSGAWGELTPTLMNGFHEGLDIGSTAARPSMGIAGNGTVSFATAARSTMWSSSPVRSPPTQRSARDSCAHQAIRGRPERRVLGAGSGPARPAPRHCRSSCSAA